MSEQENLDAVLDPATPPRRNRAPKANIVGEAVAPPVSNEPNIVSSRHKTSVEGSEGPKLRMRVTAKGHAEISAGSDHGFDRYARFTEFTATDETARSLFNKGWAEPLENVRDTIMRWERANMLDRARDARRGKALSDLMEHGAQPGQAESWNG